MKQSILAVAALVALSACASDAQLEALDDVADQRQEVVEAEMRDVADAIEDLASSDEVPSGEQLDRLAQERVQLEAARDQLEAAEAAVAAREAALREGESSELSGGISAVLTLLGTPAALAGAGGTVGAGLLARFGARRSRRKLKRAATSVLSGELGDAAHAVLESFGFSSGSVSEAAASLDDVMDRQMEGVDDLAFVASDEEDDLPVRPSVPAKPVSALAALQSSEPL